MKIGIIGCGNISGIYLKNLMSFSEVEVKAVADTVNSKAEAQALKYGVDQVMTVEDMLNDNEIELVVNLTNPAAHADVCKKVLEAGKHVYVEKPLAADLEDGEALVRIAKEKNLRIGCAPDTFLGAGIQTCKKLIDDGGIGRPLSVSGFMMNPGHESWHPDPAFYYEHGGGPMYDMGPYYLTAFIQLLGPIHRVTASASKAFSERTITSKQKYGEIMQVETPTHLAGTLDFKNGIVGTLITSFDTFTTVDYPNIEIYGTEGSIRVPDPNTFSGPVLLRKPGEKEWTNVEINHQYKENSRGLGVLDMVYSIRNNRPHRANGVVGLHVLEAMYGFHYAAEKGVHYVLKNQCQSPAPLSVKGICN
ncbi:Gfo/Idh/MocA family oxidoreductase [Evansella sp. AB-P1]|uniref:Gfo/Idh/MocA family protein n=1 Tax=Evansella sp. AB-P1 TaxID=3037653 RepID=UPI00241E0CA7|nr:Gfo/Idh/MocA family oxidoreductase [Evansella sp. AB-P1]MDG5786720.1 Gfo/Idh/MocA family oxidoreductase [Evansella sp. AB-P1]